ERAGRREASVVEHEPDTAAALAVLHLADEQRVIAGRVLRVVTTFEPRDATVDQRCAGEAEAMRHAGKAVAVRLREATRKLYLVVREHVDDVAFGSAKRGHRRRAGVEAPDDQRRVE